MVYIGAALLLLMLGLNGYAMHEGKGQRLARSKKYRRLEIFAIIGAVWALLGLITLFPGAVRLAPVGAILYVPVLICSLVMLVSSQTGEQVLHDNRFMAAGCASVVTLLVIPVLVFIAAFSLGIPPGVK